MRPLRVCFWIRWRSAVLGLLFAFLASHGAFAQQLPIALVGGAAAPKGCLFPYEDSRGRIWFAGCETGYEGVYSFDGTNFLSPDGLMNGAVVRGLAEDTDGGIWLASSEGLYRIYHGQLTRLFEGITLAGITSIAPDVFLLTMKPRSAGFSGTSEVTRLSRVSGRWRLDNILSGMPDIQFSKDSSGQVLYGCDDGYCEFSSDEVVRWRPGERLKVHTHLLGTGKRFADSSAAVLRDRFGCIWLRNKREAAHQCPGEVHLESLSAKEIGIGYPQIRELQDGSILIPSFAKLTIGRPGKMQVSPIPTCGIILPLREGGLLASGAADGMIYFPRHLGIEFWTASQGLGGNTWSMVTQERQVYALADQSSHVLEKSRRQWRRLRGPSGRMTAGPDGTVFVTSANQVFQMTPDWKILRKSKKADVQFVSMARDGNIWAGGTGLYQVTIRGKSLDLIAIPSSASLRDVTSIDESPNGDIWVCSMQGLSKKAVGGDSLSQIEIPSRSGCEAVAAEPDGSLWYGPRSGRELYWIEASAARKPVIHVLPVDRSQGIMSNFIGVDHRGWIWRGGTEGLYIADHTQALNGQWVHLGFTDGLPAVNSNSNAFTEGRDGSIWYGADNDVIHISVPDDLVHPTFAPVVFISALSSGPAGRLTMADSGRELKNDSPVSATIGSAQFGLRESLHYRYKLIPEQPSWIVTTGASLHLGRLSWGTHTLQVQAQLGGGPWSKISEQSFTVLKPVWLTWPALAGFVVVGSGLAAGGGRWRRKRRARARKAFPELAELRLSALSPELQHLGGELVGGRFEAGNILARGGFATVVEGRDLAHDGRACAIKIFRQELIDKDWMARRFRQEVLALSKIGHPSVVRIFGSGELPGGAFYLVMEFIDGITLRDVLEIGKISPQRTASYLRQIGSALEQIHAHGICHRDLKPENLMIRKDAALDESLVLIDFSIAIVKDPDETLHGLSRAAGTIYYMAPEQAIGFADASTDIYSLAKIVIEMLTGKRLSLLLPDASMDLPDRVRELLVTLELPLSSPAIELLSSALEFDPARRPKNAADFAERIAEDLDAGSIVVG